MLKPLALDNVLLDGATVTDWTKMALSRGTREQGDLCIRSEHSFSDRLYGSNIEG
jgi:hypothetical protein